MSCPGKGLLSGALLSVLIVSGARGGEAHVPVPGLIRDLCGPNASAEWRAARRLVVRGDAAVPALAQLAAARGPLPPRLVAVELLGEIGTQAARQALLDLLRTERRNLAVRSQLCMQLGYLRETRAVPIIAQWLETIGPRALHDVRGPKEVQPSTCYARHIEALVMIGDVSAIPAIERFARRIPRNVGYGGFISNFIRGGANRALASLRARQVFWSAVRKRPGLEPKLAPVFAHLRSDRVARFRFHEELVIGRTARGKAVLRELAKNTRRKVAASAQALLGAYDQLKQ